MAWVWRHVKTLHIYSKMSQFVIIKPNKTVSCDYQHLYLELKLVFAPTESDL